MSLRILIVYATAGAGHRKAAEAIAQGFKSSGNSVQVTLADSLDFTYPFFKKAYSGIYTTLITHFPAVWGFFFTWSDVPVMRPVVALVRRIYNQLNAGRLHRYLKNEQFDWIISTHFLGTEVSAALKRSGQIRSKIVTVVTDFDVHSIWLAKGVDVYTVASDWTFRKIVSMGVLPDQVKVTGIPTHENFTQVKDVQALRVKLGLRQDQFTVLLATGSFGIGPMAEILAALKNIQTIVICGHNQNLVDKLQSLNISSAKIFGLVHNMDEMMAVSNLMITKPGGLSISEALVSHLPMIFFNAIPGQETHNIQVLSQYGVGLNGLSISAMVSIIEYWKSYPEEFSKLKLNIAALARPNAVNDIMALCR